MQKTMSAFETRRQFGKVLDGVMARGDEVIVERHGDPVAAVVPMSDFKRLQESRASARETFFGIMEQAQEYSDLSPEEADALAAEAVFATRLDRALEEEGFYSQLFRIRDGQVTDPQEIDRLFSEAMEMVREHVLRRAGYPVVARS